MIQIVYNIIDFVMIMLSLNLLIIMIYQCITFDDLYGDLVVLNNTNNNTDYYMDYHINYILPISCNSRLYNHFMNSNSYMKAIKDYRRNDIKDTIDIKSINKFYTEYPKEKHIYTYTCNIFYRHDVYMYYYELDLTPISIAEVSLLNKTFSKCKLNYDKLLVTDWDTSRLKYLMCYSCEGLEDVYILSKAYSKLNEPEVENINKYVKRGG